MNVSAFYLLIGAMLAGVFFFFKPLKVGSAPDAELAQIELERFVVHEVTQNGVKTILAGAHAWRYEDRYEMQELNLTDRSETHIENMQARHGVYKEPMISLREKVHYRRDDGIEFETQVADYNQTSGLMRTEGPFVLWQAQDRIDGENLVYNTKSGDITAERIVGNYFVKERP